MKQCLILLIALTTLGCQATSQLAKQKLGEVVGQEKTESIVKVAEAARKGFEDLTPQEEYYIGRAVAANILARYQVLDQESLTRYVTKVGQTVVWASDRPETFGGYHFRVLDTDDPLAYSAPGGFIFISRGLMKTMKDEEELACVLAHEVAHVSAGHGLSAIKQSRLMDAFSILVAEGKKYSSEEVTRLANIYEGALDDIVTMLVEKGYSRTQETEADRLGAVYAARAGYDPAGLVSFLTTLKTTEGKTMEIGLVKSHPNPGERMDDLQGYLHKQGLNGRTDPARTARFSSMKQPLW